MKAAVLALGIVSVAAAGSAQEWLDTVERRLALQTRDGRLRTELSGLLDLEGYYVDQRPPGLLFENKSFFNPRLSLFLDTRLGAHFYSFVQVRVDRGFDPGEKSRDARFDEYLLRWTPWTDSRANVQFGKFATVTGSWVRRHDSWENPLITAPLPYENLTPASDEDVPTGPRDFLARRRRPDQKETWLPIIWGPAYTTGWEVFGTLGKFDYAVDLKNAAISSHPYSWEVSDSLWKNPTFSARLGFRPSPKWNHGLSFSAGPYLSSEAAESLPSGRKVGDFNQYTFDYDVSFAFRHWQVWSEVFVSRFQLPNVGNADVLSYYLEAKYKITSGLFAAVRWNQEYFGHIPNGFGENEAWGSDMYRVDLALGERFTRHLQAKLQYSLGRRAGALQQGEQLVAAQVTLKF